MRTLVLSTFITLMTVNAARAQVIADPNQIRGRIEFTNSSPDILRWVNDFMQKGLGSGSPKAGPNV